MSLTDLLATLPADPAFRARLVAWETLPARDALYAPWPATLDPRLQAALHTRGIHALYTHQAAAASAALRGENVVVATTTASGKTLCYNLPILHTVLNDPHARALYLFPTKALTQDQRTELAAWQAALDAPFAVQTYDGDTPQARRASARTQAALVLTNPDMLHVGLLPQHTRWADFLRNLRFIVLDELHTYRGIFGAHVANVLRRLRRVCAFYGSAPQVLCTSATLANPLEHAERVLEAPVTLIGPEQDGAPRGEKHILLLNPPVTDAQLGVRRSVVLESKDFAARLIIAGVQTLVFARARQTVEVLLGYLRDAMPPDLRPLIRGYRGGYLPDLRRAIEHGLRDGTVRGVVATNALELGIDIGQLDACVLTGYPGTLAALWQQAGRAGRRQASALVALIASGAPLDQYLMTHPRYLFERSPENALLNPDNLAILVQHLRCAASELPFAPDDTFGHYGSVADLLDYLVEQGVVVRGARRYTWIAPEYPAAHVNLRTSGDDRIVIHDRTSDPARVLGELDRASAALLAHAGAVYGHEGQTFLIERLDLENSLAEAYARDLDYYTNASTSVQVAVLETHAALTAPPALPDPAPTELIHHAWGDVQVTAQVTGFRKIKRYTHETLGWGQVDLPPQEMITTAYWLAFSAPLTKRLEQAGLLLAPNDYGPNWPAQRDLARARDGYRCRTCGAPERPTRQHDVHHIRPFREFGYVPGVNTAYLIANQLGNLATLCTQCHRRAEAALGRTSAFSGLGNVLCNLAPLFLMGDPRDLALAVETRATDTGLPTLTFYERVPGGVGLAARLFDLRATLLTAAAELVATCPCDTGCPACVGPVGEVGLETKALTARLAAVCSEPFPALSLARADL